MQRKYRRTNIFIIDEEMWAWARYRAKLLQYRSVSEYLFYLIEPDKKGHIKETLAISSEAKRMNVRGVT